MVVLKNRKEGRQLAPIVLVVIFSVIILMLGFIYLADTQSEKINFTENLFKAIQNILE